MIGPYTAEVLLGPRGYLTREPDLVLSFEEMYYADGTGKDAVDRSAGFISRPISSAAKKAGRFYRDGASGTKDGTTKLAAFYVGELLEPGEEATVSIYGREAGRGDDHALADSVGVRRDESGRLFLTLGSRWARERHFVGA